MNRTEIQINRSTVVAFFLIVIILLGVVFIPKILENQSPQEITGEDIAVMAAERFFTVEYTGQTKWEDQLCEISTKGGCNVIRELLSPAFWPTFEQHQTVSKATALDAELVATREESLSGRTLYIYKIPIEISELWPGMESDPKYDPHPLVLQVDGEWKFDMMLTDDKLDQLYAELAEEGLNE